VPGQVELTFEELGQAFGLQAGGTAQPRGHLHEGLNDDVDLTPRDVVSPRASTAGKRLTIPDVAVFQQKTRMSNATDGHVAAADRSAPTVAHEARDLVWPPPPAGG